MEEPNIRTIMGARVKELRTQRGMSMQQLADAAGITKANVCNIEAGKYSVGIDILYRIGVALNADLRLVSMESD